jgi:hypothetical protein
MEQHWSLFLPARHAWGRGLPPAWMNTGDAELLAPGDLGDWRNCYRNELAMVRALAVPHHGSDRNSDAALQALCPGARLLAQVRARSSKHPGEAVIAAGGDRLTLVTDEIGSTVRMTFEAY